MFDFVTSVAWPCFIFEKLMMQEQTHRGTAANTPVDGAGVGR